MVHITEELVRRRAEHNEGEMFSLEELSLHQQDLHQIQHLQQWCRNLRILYLQNNLISTIENLGRLKKLEYLNLALNNIEIIENLEGCESLQKLDLTVNFIGRLSSVQTLTHNLHLRALFLTGNPCSDFRGYREYVLCALPQLQFLDGAGISRSERLRAAQGHQHLLALVQEQEEAYVERRSSEKERLSQEERRRTREQEEQRGAQHTQEEQEEQRGAQQPQEEQEEQRGAQQPQEEQRGAQHTQEEQRGAQHTQEEQEEQRGAQHTQEEQRGAQHPQEEQEEQRGVQQPRGGAERPRSRSAEEQEEKDFWQTPCSFSPESRLEAHRRLQEKRRTKENSTEKKPSPPRTAKDGRVLNVNEAKLGFSLTEDEDRGVLLLDLAVYRHLASSLIHVDVQPLYVRVLVKEKVFQMVLPAEVKPDASIAQRSQSTGHLLLSLPLADGEVRVKKKTPRPQGPQGPQGPLSEDRCRTLAPVDFTNIVQPPHSREGPLDGRGSVQSETSVSALFVDDPEVPPLM